MEFEFSDANGEPGSGSTKGLKEEIKGALTAHLEKAKAVPEPKRKEAVEKLARLLGEHKSMGRAISKAEKYEDPEGDKAEEPKKKPQLSPEVKELIRHEVAEQLLGMHGINMAALEAKMKDHMNKVLMAQAEALSEFTSEQIEKIKAHFMSELEKL